MLDNFITMVDEAYELLDNLKLNDKIDNDLLLPKLDVEITVTKLYWKNIMEYLNILNHRCLQFS